MNGEVGQMFGVRFDTTGWRIVWTCFIHSRMPRTLPIDHEWCCKWGYQK